MKVGIIGGGTIGGYIARAIKNGVVKDMQVVAVADNQFSENVKRIVEFCECIYIKEVSNLIQYNPELVIEAASQEVVDKYISSFLESGIDVMIMSVGALVNEELCSRLFEIAIKNKRRIYIPSGAIGGLDVIKAAKVAGLKEVVLTTTKHPRALAGAPFIVKRGIDINSIKEKTQIYEGNAIDAALEFPQNLNVAAILSLAGIGAKNTKIRVIADPHTDKNIHEIYAEGSFGELRIQLSNVPSPKNPKTSYLACLSAIATLQKISTPIHIGN